MASALEIGPRIDRMLLATLAPPQWHPRAADGTIEVFGYVVHHPDGVVLVDTGMGSDSQFLDELYAPETVDIVTALNGFVYLAQDASDSAQDTLTA